MNKKEYEEILESLTKKVELLSKQLDELNNIEIEEDVVWKPTIGEKYWFILGASSNVSFNLWDYTKTHEKRLSIGNVFKTEEEARFEIERLKVINELKQFSCEFKAGSDNYYIYLDCENDDLSYAYRITRFQQGEIFFESVYMLKEAIEKVGEQRLKKYLFNVKSE